MCSIQAGTGRARWFFYYRNKVQASRKQGSEQAGSSMAEDGGICRLILLRNYICALPGWQVSAKSRERRCLMTPQMRLLRKIKQAARWAISPPLREGQLQNVPPRPV
jgi:hypothetical protein